jgi:hypothetical protein
LGSKFEATRTAGWLGAATRISLVAAIVATAVLTLALDLGWNSPRVSRKPDWQATSLPFTLEAQPHKAQIGLMEYEVADFTMTIEAHPSAGPAFNGYGLIYRAQDSQNYYAFAIGGDGYYSVLRVEDGEPVSLLEWRPFPHVHQGPMTNRLRVTCKGTACTYYINDEFAALLEDTRYRSGRVGLFVRSFDPQRVAVRFLSVRVWEEACESRIRSATHGGVSGFYH